MRMENPNATTNQKHTISLGVLPFVWMRSTMATKWIPSWATGANVNGLSDRKSLHMHGRRWVSHTSSRGKVHWSLHIIRHSYSSSKLKDMRLHGSVSSKTALGVIFPIFITHMTMLIQASRWKCTFCVWWWFFWILFEGFLLVNCLLGRRGVSGCQPLGAIPLMFGDTLDSPGI